MKAKPTVNIWDFAHQTGPVPLLLGQRETVTCPHCSKMMLIAVREEFVDWELVAKDYKRYSEHLIKLVNKRLLFDPQMEILKEILERCAREMGKRNKQEQTEGTE